MTLFERVKELTKKRGMSISEVERKAGLSENYLYTWKKSENPRRSSITAVAKVLGVSVDYLIGKDSSPAKPKIDLADDDRFIALYEGKPVSDDDMEIIRRLLRGK